MEWGFPENVSTFGDKIDDTYGMIFYATALMFVIVQGALVYFAIRYRHRPGRRAKPIHGNTRLEIVWTAATAVGVLLLAATSVNVWLDIKRAERFPANAMPLAVHAKQFEWTVTYPGNDGRLGTPDDFTRRNQLHIPVGRPVRVTLTAEEVIHSFFLPQFRVKQDAVPGMSIPVWFEATRTGQFVLGCAELCGLGHYRMRGSVTVHSAQEFEAWQRSGGAVATSRPAEPTTVAAR
jgi:cytochrome c oxidase subunit II